AGRAAQSLNTQVTMLTRRIQGSRIGDPRTTSMIRVLDRIRYLLALLFALTGLICGAPYPALAQDAGAHLTEITRGALRPPSTVKYTDDLDGLLARHTVRVLVVPNLTNYFIDRGSEHGLTYESFILFG